MFEAVTGFYRDFGVGMYGLNKAFRLEGDEETGISMRPISNMQPVCLEDLVGYELQKKMLIENTEAFAWLMENAYRFGFILRYPENKTDITGYKYEAWHYRFVGREAAIEMHENNLCLEEYLK